MKIIGYLLLLIIVTLQTPRFVVTAYKQGHPSLLPQVKAELETYIEEAHYPDDFTVKAIASDLKSTLELDDCVVVPLD